MSLAACWSVLAGLVVQLAQTALWTDSVYLGLGGVAVMTLASWGWMRRSPMASLRRGSSTPVRGQHVAQGVMFCAGLALLAFAQAGWRATAHAARIVPAAVEGRTLRAQGQVLGLPQSTPEGVRFRFRIDRLLDTPKADWPHALGSIVWVGWYAPEAQALRADEQWVLPLKLKAPHGHVNPHGFDYELWLWEQSVVATGYVRVTRDSAAPQRWREASPWSVSRWRESAREHIRQRVPEPQAAGVLTALLLGDQASIERADWDVFRATGVAHLMAISGLHITGIAWLAGWLLAAVWRWMPWSWRGRALPLWLPAPVVGRLGSIVAAMIYAVFSGWGVPAQRTVWMLCIVHVLALRARQWPWPLTWSLVAAWVLVWDPWAMRQAGFILSFVAVGVLFASGHALELDASVSFVKRRRRAIVRFLKEQAVMSVCLAPLSLILFQQVSVVGWLANLVAVPWVTLLVTPLTLLGLLVPDAWAAAAWAVQVMTPVLQTMAHWPFAQWSVAAAPWWAAVAAVLGGFCLAMPWPWSWRIVGCCWCMPLLTWQVPRPQAGQFELWAADMGQGHAVLVRTPHHALLYDTGPRYSSETDAGQRVVVPLLRALGERLDRVMLSHQDSDHSGGLHAVMSMQPQVEIWTSVSPTHPMLTEWRSQACQKGQRWEWDGVRFEVLHPRATDRLSKPNAMSCVLRITGADGARALLVGDIEAEQERRLVDSGESLRADWLLVPHHGSNTSSTTAFLQATQPTWAVVQAGYRNRYGHPRAEVMARYAQEGISVVQTTQCGASVWRSVQPAQMQCERVSHPHYWHHKVP